MPINTVRDLLPQLRNGKVIRGRIGVTVTPVPREDYRGVRPEDASRRDRRVGDRRAARPRRPAWSRATSSCEYNGRPVANSDELVKMVVGDQAGHVSVPVKVLRNKQEKTLNLTVDELDLEAEQQSRGRRSPGQDPEPDDSQDARRLRPDARQRHAADGASAASCRPARAARVVTDVEPDGPAAGAAAGRAT